MSDTGREQTWLDLGQRIGQEIGRRFYEQTGIADAISQQVSIGPEMVRKIVGDSGITDAVADAISQQVGPEMAATIRRAVLGEDADKPYIPQGLRYGAGLPPANAYPPGHG